MTTRFYGGQGEERNTIHSTDYVDVEVHNGEVVSVWFRCSVLPFRQTRVDRDRAREMTRTGPELPRINGIVFEE